MIAVADIPGDLPDLRRMLFFNADRVVQAHDSLQFWITFQSMPRNAAPILGRLESIMNAAGWLQILTNRRMRVWCSRSHLELISLFNDEFCLEQFQHRVYFEDAVRFARGYRPSAHGFSLTDFFTAGKLYDPAK